MEPAQLAHRLVAGAQEEMIGVGEHQLRPAARTSPGVRPFTVPSVATGMNAGVSTAPCGVTSRPAARRRRWP
jgi:hypothetical protein